MDIYTAQEMAYKHGYEKGYNDAMKSITRCNDCKYCYYDNDNFEWFCDFHGVNMNSTDFCSYGERKDNG